MRERSGFVVWGLVAAIAALACQGHPIPLSAQKGATILIPLAGLDEEDQGSIGFGSQVYDDRQRGALVFQLDGPGGPELVTRATTALAGPLASQHGIASPFGPRSDLIVSLVDVPNTPQITEGTHALHVVRRLGGVDLPGPDYGGAIAILPAAIAAGGETMLGAPTPFQLLESPYTELESVIKYVVPDPQVLFAPRIGVRALELEITFPSNLVSIRDVTEALLAAGPAFDSGVSESHRAHTWWKTLATGRLAVGMLSPTRAIRGVSVVFALKATTTAPVAGTAFAIENVRAYDASGDPVAPGWVGPWIR